MSNIQRTTLNVVYDDQINCTFTTDYRSRTDIKSVHKICLNDEDDEGRIITQRMANDENSQRAISPQSTELIYKLSHNVSFKKQSFEELRKHLLQFKKDVRKLVPFHRDKACFTYLIK